MAERPRRVRLSPPMTTTTGANARYRFLPVGYPHSVTDDYLEFVARLDTHCPTLTVLGIKSMYDSRRKPQKHDILKNTRTPYRPSQAALPASYHLERFFPVLVWEIQPLRRQLLFSSRSYKNLPAELQPSYSPTDLEPPWSQNARCIAFWQMSSTTQLSSWTAFRPFFRSRYGW